MELVKRAALHTDEEVLTPKTYPLTAARSAVTSLSLTRFRNYASLELECGTANVVLTGPNGAGKTNILEALSLLAPGRGFHSATLQELVQQPDTGQGWAVSVMLDNGIRIGTGQVPGQADKRQIRIDGEPIKQQSELMQQVSVLWQTPQMDTLFCEGASARRRYFDRLAGSFDPDHAARVARYDYYRRERAKLLTYRNPDVTWLSSIERKMAEATLAIAAARLEALSALRFALTQLDPVFPQAQIALRGLAEEALVSGQQSALETEDRIAAALATSREDDARNGRASQGAHKTELVVMHPDKNMEAAYCSTGEQKALMLSLLLAQAQATSAARQRTPILLLDEVVSHLDNTKRQALFTTLSTLNAQCWLTGTDEGLFEGLGGKRVNLPFS